MAKETKTELQKGGNGPHATHVMTPFEEMERMFENFMGAEWPRPMQWEWPRMLRMRMPMEAKMPRVDVIDRKADILVRAELPGVDKKDLDVSLSENSVTIKGSTRQESKQEEGDYYRCEISQGAFMRTLPLPCAVNSDAAKASFKDGLLELVLPKREESRRRSVKVE